MRGPESHPPTGARAARVPPGSPVRPSKSPALRGRRGDTLGTRLPARKTSRTKPLLFKPSTARSTASSSRFVAGSRLFFWLQPVTRALSVSGYCPGVVWAFSMSVPSTRHSSGGSRIMAESVSRWRHALSAWHSMGGCRGLGRTRPRPRCGARRKTKYLGQRLHSAALLSLVGGPAQTESLCHRHYAMCRAWRFGIAGRRGFGSRASCCRTSNARRNAGTSLRPLRR